MGGGWVARKKMSRTRGGHVSAFKPSGAVSSSCFTLISLHSFRLSPGDGSRRCDVIRAHEDSRQWTGLMKCLVLIGLDLHRVGQSLFGQGQIQAANQRPA